MWSKNKGRRPMMTAEAEAGLIRPQVVALVAKLRAEGDQLQAEAARRAQQLQADAERKAEQIVADAMERADRIRAESDRELAAATQRRNATIAAPLPSRFSRSTGTSPRLISSVRDFAK